MSMCYFPSATRNSFSIFCLGLLMMNSFFFFLYLNMSLFLLHSYRIIFARYRVLGWQFYFPLSIFLNTFIYFIYFWLCWVFFASHRLSLVAVSGSYSLLWCVDFSLQWLLLLQSTGSRHAGFSSCGPRAQ